MGQGKEKRAGRSYRQYCAIARGLDVVGERWTLLIIRDLLVGPKRYKDLLDGLPGIGSNLLAARLKELEKREIVRRRVLPPPAGSTVYELTASGQELEPALVAFARWGSRFMGAPNETDTFPAAGYFVAMRDWFDPEAARDLRETYELRAGGQVLEIHVDDGHCTMTQGSARRPDVVITTDGMMLNKLLKRNVGPDEAIASGRVSIEGDERALARFVAVFNPRSSVEVRA